MAYTPKTWQCNDTITAEDLNHMEQGIAEASQGGGGTSSGILVIDADRGDYVTTLTATWQEIYDAVNSGTPVFIKYSDYTAGVTNAQMLFVTYVSGPKDGTYSVYATIGDVAIESIEYTTDSASGYPRN